MPIYEYECKKCRSEFEALVRNCEDEKKMLCPQCQSQDVVRIMSCFSTASRSGSSAGCSSGSSAGRFT
ncbi:MAG: zinc ribbon domain-containing protein [Deltaproteobacteria bacterium]|nr:zinc ribbon domain-containing protein [Deltaproteobacteria bacterium]